MTGKDHHGFIAMAQEYPQRFTQAQNIVSAGRFAGGVCGRFWFGARIQHHASLVLRFEAEDAAGMSRIQAEFRTGPIGY